MVTVGTLTLMTIVEVTLAVTLLHLALVIRYWLDGTAVVEDETLYINVGLFKTNVNTDGNTVEDTADFLPSATGTSVRALRDIRILVCFGGACSVLSLVLANVLVLKKRDYIVAGFMILSTLSGICTLVGVSLFHAHYSHLCSVSFSWVLALLASFLMTSSTVVMGCAVKRGDIQYGDERFYIRLS